MIYEIEPISKIDLLGKWFPAFLKFFKSHNLERFPEEKPWDEEMIRRIVDREEDCQNRFIARDSGEIVGYSSVGKWLNGETGSFLCSVLKNHRNSGLGSKLVILSLSKAFEQGYRSVFSQTYNEAGERFAAKLGGDVIGCQSTRMLELARVDWNLVADWISDSISKNPDLKIVFQTTIHDAQLEPLSRVSMEISDELFALNRYRAKATFESEEKEWRRRQDESKEPGKTRLFLFATDHGDQILGYTFCVINSSDPSFVTQGMTAVPKEFRGRGLGKLLKASMLEKLRENYKSARVVRTFNNDLNAPMVAINNKLGFERKSVYTDFMLDISTAVGKLRPDK